MASVREPSIEQLRALAQVDPDDVLRELDKLDSEASLRDFIKLHWSAIEPGRVFIPGWHIDCIAEHLEAVHRGEILRILFNIPPGCMKSLTTNAGFPAWEWGPKNRPDLRYVSASYSQDLTIRDNRRCRAIIASEAYQRSWGDRFQLDRTQNAKTRFDNDKMGFKIATSVGGLGAGERGDRFVIDDPHNTRAAESEAVRKETLLWFSETVPTRLSDPQKSAIIVVMQRLHERDVSGWILEKELGYVHVCLPMEFEPDRRCFVEVTGFSDPRQEENELLWPERMTRVVVERDKKSLQEYAVAGQFQQRPSPRGGGMFKRTWWQFFETGHKNRPLDVTENPAVPKPPVFDWIVMSVDAAFKATATGSRVGMVVVGGKGPFRYVIDNATAPMTFSKTIETIQLLLKRHPTCSRVLIEDKANGPAIVDTLRTKISGIISVNPEGGKEARASAMQPSVESGHWLLPEGAAWLDDFITEFAMFPASDKNDQVDATTQACNYMTQSVDVARAIDLGKW